jgi:hypothetical protein
VLNEARERGGEAGQASVELVAVLPLLIACVVITAHGAAAGWALWSAANAARAGARADHVGGDGERAARRALPAPLREGAEVKAGDGVRVTVRAPLLLPGLSGPRLGASSALDPAGG